MIESIASADGAPKLEASCGYYREGPCVYFRHVWPDDWCEGDTCACGAFYLKSGVDGGVEILGSIGRG